MAGIKEHRREPRCRIGLAFGGGLPFGLVALGVKRAFDEAEIPVARLAGASMGSIIAASWALGLTVDDCLGQFKDAFSKKHMLAALLRDLSFSPSGVLRGAAITGMLESFLGKGCTFEELEIPLRVPGCDLVTGTEVVFESGPLIPAIRASISLPGVFTPFRYQGRVLVDGALIRPIPVHLLGEDEVDLKIPIRAVRRRAPHQLQHDVANERRRHRLHLLRSGATENVFSVMWRSLSLIMQDEFAEMIFDDYDLYIRPELDLEVSRDPSRMDEIVQAGYEETLGILPHIRRALAEGVTAVRRQRRADDRRDRLGDGFDDEVGVGKPPAED